MLSEPNPERKAAPLHPPDALFSVHPRDGGSRSSICQPHLKRGGSSDALADATHDVTERQMMTTPLLSAADVRAAGAALAYSLALHVDYEADQPELEFCGRFAGSAE